MNAAGVEGELGMLLSSRKLASDVLARTTLRHLAQADLEELERLMPPRLAVRVRSAMQLAFAAMAPPISERLLNAEAAFGHFYPYFAGADTERMVAAALDAQHRPVHTEVVALGGASSVSFRAADVLAPAVRHRAVGLIVSHNHPSMSLAPSENDLGLTRKLLQAAALLNIALLDHLVVAGQGFRSLRDELLSRGLNWPRPAISGLGDSHG